MDNATRMMAIVPVKPQVEKLAFDFQWNKDQIETFISQYLEKYRGLVVTDENLEDMQKACREVVKVRTSIQKFSMEYKRKLKEPYNRFDKDCKEILELVADVEMPIQEQLAVYESKRKQAKRDFAINEYQAKARAMGLEEKFWQIDIPEKWLNKGQKDSDTCIEIDRLIKSQLEIQESEQRKEQVIEQAKELLTLYVERANREYGLKTPLTADELVNNIGIEDISKLSMTDMKQLVNDSARNIKAIEIHAEEVAKAEAEKAKEKENSNDHDVQPNVQNPDENVHEAEHGEYYDTLTVVFKCKTMSEMIDVNEWLEQFQNDTDIEIEMKV